MRVDRPAPGADFIEHRERVRVRFREVDAIDVVWHGNYLSYFEVAREGFGKAHILGFEDFRRVNVCAPIVHVSCDFLAPARYGDELEVIARLLPDDAPKIEFHFTVVRTADRRTLATGVTRQVFIDGEGKLLLTQPGVLRDFYDRREQHVYPTDE